MGVCPYSLMNTSNEMQHLRLFWCLQEHQKGVRLGRRPAEAQRPRGFAQLQRCVLDYGAGREAKPRSGKQGPKDAGCQGKLKPTLG